MTLQDAINRKTRFAVAVDRGSERLVAEIYIVSDGIVFLDIGWSEPFASSFRAHHMRGEITGDGPWQVGDWKIREIDPETDPEYLEEWKRWEAYKAETGGSRERGSDYAAQILEMKVDLS